jgi:D-alanyl-D-alanine-carboxypeptidase/D-alanyl-D-alanine-endopeptidase
MIYASRRMYEAVSMSWTAPMSPATRFPRITRDNGVLTRRDFMLALGAAAVARATGAFEIGDDDIVRDILRRRIDVEKRSVGMAVCVVTPDRQRTVTWGRERLSDSHPVSPDTVFEIASITKVFTALLLASMALRGEVGLDDPVALHLPGDFHVPRVEGRQITLADLATHTSGLPWWPPFPGEPQSFDIAFMMAAIPQYTLERFRAWLADFRLPKAPGSEWAYGNTDYALLSMALAHRGGLSYEELLQARVIGPLGLTETVFRPAAAMAPRLSEGHNNTLKPEPPMDVGIFAAAGGLHSTPRDMARFAAAMLPDSRGSIAPAARLLLTVRRPAPPINGMQALGWELRDAPGGTFVSKDGVSWSQGASIVFDPTLRKAVVAFSNTAPDLRYAKYSGGGVGAADVAQHVLRPQIPLGGRQGTTY